MRIALYPGTFDPITNGHLDIIKRALNIFDHLIVAVACSLDKKPLFSVEERVEMIKELTQKWEQVTVDYFYGLTVEYAKAHNVCAIIRGLRAVSDFEYEFQLALMNRNLNPDVETVFLIPNERYTYLSSRIIKEIVNFGGGVSEFLAESVERKLREKLGSVFRDKGIGSTCRGSDYREGKIPY